MQVRLNTANTRLVRDAARTNARTGAAEANMALTAFYKLAALLPRKKKK